MSLLKISNLKKNFDDLEVLKDISLKVEEGEVNTPVPAQMCAQI